jgi:acetate kinase
MSGAPSLDGPVLVLNSGSSSLKFGLYAHVRGEESPLVQGAAKHIGAERGTLSLQDAHGRTVFEESARYRTQEDAFGRVAERLEALGHAPPVALGHRVVHGGPHLREHQALTDAVLEQLEAAVHFAPLHVPAALTLIRDSRARYPGVAQFVCFDTAFHRTLPEAAARFALPRQYAERGVRRYGFHGLSYESIVRRLGPDVPARTVVAHLGSGASLAALEHGRSVDTTMGFTPTGGIPMGTRSGDLDPGVLLWLLRQEGLDADALEHLVNHDAGLQALSGRTSDVRVLTEAARAGDAEAELALTVFCRAIAKTVGACAAVLGGLDLLVFTGGIGENSPEVRERVCSRLGYLGLTVRVLPSEEEPQIARHVRRLLRG